MAEDHCGTKCRNQRKGSGVSARGRIPEDNAARQSRAVAGDNDIALRLHTSLSAEEALIFDEFLSLCGNRDTPCTADPAAISPDKFQDHGAGCRIEIYRDSHHNSRIPEDMISI